MTLQNRRKNPEKANHMHQVSAYLVIKLSTHHCFPGEPNCTSHIQTNVNYQEWQRVLTGYYQKWQISLCSGSASWIFPFAKQKVLIQPNAITFIYQEEILVYK